MNDLCKHDLDPTWCATCLKRPIQPWERDHEVRDLYTELYSGNRYRVFDPSLYNASQIDDFGLDGQFGLRYDPNTQELLADD